MRAEVAATLSDEAFDPRGRVYACRRRARKNERPRRGPSQRCCTDPLRGAAWKLGISCPSPAAASVKHLATTIFPRYARRHWTKRGDSAVDCTNRAFVHREPQSMAAPVQCAFLHGLPDMYGNADAFGSLYGRRSACSPHAAMVPIVQCSLPMALAMVEASLRSDGHAAPASRARAFVPQGTPRCDAHRTCRDTVSLHHCWSISGCERMQHPSA